MLRAKITERHQALALVLQQLSSTVARAMNGTLSSADVHAASIYAQEGVIEDVSGDERAFVPLIRLCFFTKHGDPADFVVEADERTLRASKLLLAAAEDFSRYGNSEASRAHFARSVLRLERAVAEHIDLYDGLLRVAEDCLSEANWEEGLKALHGSEARSR